jgi:DNA repair ATPase RecN
MRNNKEIIISEVIDKTLGHTKKDDLNEGLFDGIKAIGAGVKKAFTGIGDAYKTGKITFQIQKKIDEMKKSIEKIDSVFEQQVDTFAEANAMLKELDKTVADPMVRQEVKNVLQSIDFFNGSLKKLLSDYKEAMNNIPNEISQPEDNQNDVQSDNTNQDPDWEELINSINI